MRCRQNLTKFVYIPLETIDLWEVEGEFDPAAFFKAVPLICEPTDVIGIGSYDVSDEALVWLTANEISLTPEEMAFSDSFDFNRREYPDGRAYLFHPNEYQLENLSALSQLKMGGVEKDLFFDHVLIYRLGEPIIPLLDFHDAFTGGSLYLSGHYSEKTMLSFAAVLNGVVRRVLNPALPAR